MSALTNPLPGLVGATRLGKGTKRKAVGLSTGAIPANPSLDLIRKHKAIDGYGTDAGLYSHPFPDVIISHFKEAVASEPGATNPKITIACASNEIIRSVFCFKNHAVSEIYSVTKDT